MMIDRLYRRFYLWAQRRQTLAKRHKDPSFRTLRHLEMVRPYVARFYPEIQWPEPVLCLGPRNGIELTRLREAGAKDVIGLDLISSSPEILVGDMHAMPFEADRFGMVWASHVLEHALEPRKVFTEIARVVRPGGYLMAAYPTNFQPNWHDRWNYGAPDTLLDYLPASAMLVARRTRAGESCEWAALYRLNCIG
jgi:SAM-dependent methyltransferase